MPRSRLPKSQVEISALKYYKKKLATEEKKLGRGITYDEDLAARGRELFGAKFNGVYPSDVTRPFRGYSIVNLDGKDEPGSHWAALVVTVFLEVQG